MVNYTIKKNKTDITLTNITTGKIIKNLTPYEAYSIMYNEEIPNAVTAFIERLDLLPDNSSMFGSEVKDLMKNSFHPIMKDADIKIKQLAEDVDA